MRRQVNQTHSTARQQHHLAPELLSHPGLMARLPITILFLAFADGHVVEAEMAPGGSFELATRWGESGGFMFTACPAGTSPSVPFSMANKTAIVESLYNCRGRPQV